MKYCGDCKQEKEEESFGKRKASKDGLCAKCKACQSLYDKKRANLPHRIEARRNYAKTDAGRIAGNKAKCLYIKRNHKKHKAHIMVSNAIRDKKLFKEPCEVCGNTEALHAHHDDYAKPLNIRWLCPLHHSQWHEENGEGLNAK